MLIPSTENDNPTSLGFTCNNYSSTFSCVKPFISFTIQGANFEVVPMTHNEAIKGNFSEKWKEAIYEEFASLFMNEKWIEVINSVIVNFSLPVVCR